MRDQSIIIKDKVKDKSAVIGNQVKDKSVVIGNQMKDKSVVIREKVMDNTVGLREKSGVLKDKMKEQMDNGSERIEQVKNHPFVKKHERPLAILCAIVSIAIIVSILIYIVAKNSNFKKLSITNEGGQANEELLLVNGDGNKNVNEND